MKHASIAVPADFGGETVNGNDGGADMQTYPRGSHGMLCW
jgi:hypothetical protein